MKFGERLNESILETNPVPDNIQKTLKMDSYMEAYLKEKGQPSLLIPRDKSLARISKKNRDIFGPISRMWAIFDDAWSSKDGQAEINLDSAAWQMEQVVTLVGQAINSTNFLRRKLTLTSLNGSETTPLQWLRETYVEELKESEEMLFGSKFISKVKKEASTHNKTIKQLLSLPPPFFQRRPFQESSSSRTSGEGQNQGNKQTLVNWKTDPHRPTKTDQGKAIQVTFKDIVWEKIPFPTCIKATCKTCQQWEK